MGHYLPCVPGRDRLAYVTTWCSAANLCVFVVNTPVLERHFEGDAYSSSPSLIWIEQPKDKRMDAKKLKDIRRRLSSEHDNLLKSINRSRLAAEELKIENTEDETDLATISHDRGLLYNLHEGGFVRLRFIQEALKALDRGQYGECVRCEKDIPEKRLEAVPWATMCVRCQEEIEAEHTSARIALAGQDAEEAEF
jgi:DnaK suppressor protein